MRIKLFKPLILQIETKNREYLKIIREEFTSYVEGFQFMNAWKAGNWNGKTCLIHANGTFPYGLLFDVIRSHQKNFPTIKIPIDDEVKSLFLGPELEIKYELKFKPRPYQKECIEAALKYTKGIIRSATASGKSLVIAYIIRNLLNNELVSKAIIVVPSTGLIKQFKGDMLEYGIEEDIIGEVYAKSKQWNKDIVISTWQSLARNHKKLDNYECIIIDEVHAAKSFELKKILEKAKVSNYRLGFTGTMHASDLDNWNTKAYLGPIIKEYPSGFLAEEGWISHCTVHMMCMKYQQKRWSGEYNDVKQNIFERPFRLKLIKELVNKLDHNILLLVGKVEKEGEFLERYLKENTNRTVQFLSGRDNVDIREDWRKKCMEEKNIALIATYGIFQQGINIPNLKYIILAAPFKSKIRVLQSIGRALRKHADKENGAHILDIHDQTKFFKKHGLQRLRYYDSERFKVGEHLFIEGDDINIQTVLDAIQDISHDS